MDLAAATLHRGIPCSRESVDNTLPWSERLTSRLGPFWLVRKERYDEAKSVIRRIAKKGHRTDRMCDAQLEIMKEANEVEKLSAKNSSYADCFRGNNLRRTVIGVACWLIQIWAGGGVGSYATVL